MQQSKESIKFTIEILQKIQNKCMKSIVYPIESKKEPGAGQIIQNEINNLKKQLNDGI